MTQVKKLRVWMVPGWNIAWNPKCWQVVREQGQIWAFPLLAVHTEIEVFTLRGHVNGMTQK